MYNQRDNRYNQFDPNIYIPGLSLYVDIAEEIIALCSRVVGFVRGLTYGLIGK